jgi:translation initiation factor 1 (eIF-1/SUI1)
MKKTVTYSQINLFRANAQNYLAQKGLEMSKLTWALNKMLQKTETVHGEYKDKEQIIRVDLAEAEKGTGVLMVNGNNNYSYNKVNAKALTTQLRELGNTSIEIETHTITPPSSLEPIWYAFFVPFVIDEPTEESKE